MLRKPKSPCADAIVVNKTDLVRKAELHKLHGVLADLNPEAPRADATFGVVDREFFKGLVHRRKLHGRVDQPPKSVVAASFQTDRPVDRKRFHEVVEELGPKLLRLKGNLGFGDGCRFVEFIGDAVSEKTPCDSLGGGTSFSVIAWKIGREQLQKRFEALW